MRIEHSYKGHWLCHFLLIELFALSLGTNAHSQNRYSSNVIREMAETMFMTETLDTLRDGYYIDRFSWNDFSLTIFVEDNEIVHLGYSLFPCDTQDLILPAASRFLEQYVLACDLPLKRQFPIAEEQEIKGILYEQGNNNTIKQFAGDTSISINVSMINGKYYNISWVKSDTIKCSVLFPINYCLLHGTTIQESEERLFLDFIRMKDKQIEGMAEWTISPLDLIKVSDTNIYILQGDSIYVSELNNTQYYMVEDSVVEPIFTTSMPRESFSNLVVSQRVINEYNVTINLIRYGHKNSKATMPFSTLMNYFDKKGCTPYFGIIENTDSTMRGLLLLANIPEGYCHTIRLDIETNSIDTGKGIMQGRMMAYIPISKIKKLF